MPKNKDWRRIGAVTVKDNQDRINYFNTLAEAVVFVGWINVQKLKRGILGYRWINPIFRSSSGSFYDGGDSHIFIDEYGQIIPPWRVKEEADNVPNVIAPDFRYYGNYNRYRGYKPERHFRNGSVPGIGGGGKRRWSMWRYFRTTAEKRANIALDCDEDAREYGIKSRGRRRHLPSVWDDVNRSDWNAKSWKKHRQVQWR